MHTTLRCFGPYCTVRLFQASIYLFTVLLSDDGEGGTWMTFGLRGRGARDAKSPDQRTCGRRWEAPQVRPGKGIGNAKHPNPTE